MRGLQKISNSRPFHEIPSQKQSGDDLSLDGPILIMQKLKSDHFYIPHLGNNANTKKNTKILTQIYKDSKTHAKNGQLSSPYQLIVHFCLKIHPKIMMQEQALQETQEQRVGSVFRGYEEMQKFSKMILRIKKQSDCDIQQVSIVGIKEASFTLEQFREEFISRNIRGQFLSDRNIKGNEVLSTRRAPIRIFPKIYKAQDYLRIKESQKQTICNSLGRQPQNFQDSASYQNNNYQHQKIFPKDDKTTKRRQGILRFLKKREERSPRMQSDQKDMFLEMESESLGKQKRRKKQMMELDSSMTKMNISNVSEERSTTRISQKSLYKKQKKKPTKLEQASKNNHKLFEYMPRKK